MNVLKPFYFIHKVEQRRGAIIQSTARERKFAAGEHLLNPDDPSDAEVLDHPWVNEHYADGCIESPSQTRARLAAEAAAEAESQAAASVHREQLHREADAALERAELAAQRQEAAGAAMVSELDTPLDRLARV